MIFANRVLRNMTRVVAVLCMLVIAQQRAFANGMSAWSNASALDVIKLLLLVVLMNVCYGILIGILILLVLVVLVGVAWAVMRMMPQRAARGKAGGQPEDE